MRILICGAGGFIGSHLVLALRTKFGTGAVINAVDLKKSQYLDHGYDQFFLGDLRDQKFVSSLNLNQYDRIYQLAADMGGAGFVFTGEHDADILMNSALINLNILRSLSTEFGGTIFYSSSACMYPEYNQLDPTNPKCSEESAYPADPDSEYGWEKLFSERLYLAYERNYGFNVKIARFHNIFGPYGSWNDGREKAPAAICRKVAMAEDGGEIEIWGDGEQTRSFLYVDQCIEGVEVLVESAESGPFNIGSDEMISINELVDLVCSIGKKSLVIKHVNGPTGVRGRNSDNTLIAEKLDWIPKPQLKRELSEVYNWILTLV